MNYLQNTHNISHHFLKKLVTAPPPVLALDQNINFSKIPPWPLHNFQND